MDTFMDQLAEKKTAQEMIRANVAAEVEDAGQVKTRLEDLEKKLTEVHENLKDGNHKECVKVYRNVQSAFVSENEKQTTLIKEEIEKSGKRVKLAMVFAIMAFATSFVSLILQIISML